MRIHKLLLGIAFLLSIFVLGCAVHSTKLVVATDPTFPPMESVDKDGNLVGFDIDLIREIAKLGNFTIELKRDNFDNLLSALQAGTYDAAISSISITPEREKVVSFTEPYIQSSEVLIVSTNSGITNPKDLAGRVIATQSGSPVFLSALNKAQEAYGTKTKLFSEVPLAIEALLDGSISGFIYDQIYTKYTLFSVYPEKLKIIVPEIQRDPAGIAVKKGNEKVLSLIRNGLKKTVDSGEMKALMDKWLP